MGVCDDLISRQEAVAYAISGLTREIDGEKWIRVSEVRESIKALPPAQQWIPVTEQLPKLGEKVLVSTKNTVFTQVFKRIYGTPDRWGWEHHSVKKVTAWMPLPKPYKEGLGNANEID